jgi:hypothetical protein
MSKPVTYAQFPKITNGFERIAGLKTFPLKPKFSKKGVKYEKKKVGKKP